MSDYLRRMFGQALDADEKAQNYSPTGYAQNIARGLFGFGAREGSDPVQKEIHRTAEGFSSAMPLGYGVAVGPRVLGGKFKQMFDDVIQKHKAEVPGGVYQDLWQDPSSKLWMAEIPDINSNFKVIPPEFKSHNLNPFDKSQNWKGKLGDLLNHPELFEAYPHLKDIPVSWKRHARGRDVNASFHPVEGIELDAADLKDAKESLIHEIQHAIQKHEHWPGGSDPDYIPVDKIAQSRVDYSMSQIEAAKKALADPKKAAMHDNYRDILNYNLASVGLFDKLKKFPDDLYGKHAAYLSAHGERLARVAEARSTQKSNLSFAEHFRRMAEIERKTALPYFSPVQHQARQMQSTNPILMESSFMVEPWTIDAHYADLPLGITDTTK